LSVGKSQTFDACTSRRTQRELHARSVCATLYSCGIVAIVARGRRNQYSPQEQVYSPHDVAFQLGITTAALRRLAQAYERTFGELARDSRSGRVWPQEALDRLKRARTAVQDGRYVSVEVALRAIADGGDIEAMPARVGTPEDAGQQLLNELRALREAVDWQNQLINDQWHRTEELDEMPPSAVVKLGSPGSSEKSLEGVPLEAKKAVATSAVRMLPVDDDELRAELVNSVIAGMTRAKVSIWQYVIGICLSVAAVGWDVFVDLWGLLSHDVIIFSVLPLSAIVPLIFGFWVGLTRRLERLHWPSVGAVALVLSIGALSIAVAVYRIEAQSWSEAQYYWLGHDPLTAIISGLMPALLFISGAILGNALLRRVLGVAAFQGKSASTDANGAGRWTPRHQAILGFVGVVLSALIPAMATLVSAVMGNGS
jgi:hypothetical protein